MSRFLHLPRSAAAMLLAIVVLLLLGCLMANSSDELPRFSKLPAFDPYRKSFECKHEDAVNPPISQEADALFQEALALDNPDIWPDQRDYQTMARLYQQAMEKGHWKAQFNLAGLYLQGLGVAQSDAEALRLTEDLMKKGVPAAWDNMGAYYMGGVGPLRQDATVAYAFWQRAADMGSKSAQAYLGKKLASEVDDPPRVWANRQVGIQILECAYAQDSGDAAHQLGVIFSHDGQPRKNMARAMEIFHNGVKFGHEDCAGYLGSSFRSGDEFVKFGKDPARGERYHVIAQYLYYHPNTPLPNLDKVLPLPPASLPMWDGQPQTLIDAAKQVVPAAPKPHVSSALHGSNVPPGMTLPDTPLLALQGHVHHASHSGYWRPRVSTDVHSTDAFDAAQAINATPAAYYEEGQALESLLELHMRSADNPRRALWSRLSQDQRQGMVWQYLGQAQALPAQAPHVLVRQGVAVPVNTEVRARCPGDQTCPHTGIWAAWAQAALPPEASRYLPLYPTQAYVEKGQAFPATPAIRLGALKPEHFTWQWLGFANPSNPAGTVHVRAPGLEVPAYGDTWKV